MLNPELGRRVIKEIMANPGEYRMECYAVQTPCGTRACLAGRALLLSGYSVFDRGGSSWFVRPDGSVVPEGEEGREALDLLGISQEEWNRAGNLFFWTYPRYLALMEFKRLVEAS